MSLKVYENLTFPQLFTFEDVFAAMIDIGLAAETERSDYKRLYDEILNIKGMSDIETEIVFDSKNKPIVRTLYSDSDEDKEFKDCNLHEIAMSNFQACWVYILGSREEVLARIIAAIFRDICTNEI